MTSENPDIIRPMVSQSAPRSRPINFDRFVRDICIIGAIIALGLSAWFFFGFVENDLGFWHLLSAAAVSFGIGGLAFVPLGLIAWIAHRTDRSPVLASLTVAALVLPWLIISYLCFRLGGRWIIATCVLLFFTCLCLAWAIHAWRQRK